MGPRLLHRLKVRPCRIFLRSRPVGGQGRFGKQRRLAGFGCLSILDDSWPGRPGAGQSRVEARDLDIKIGHLNDRGYSLRPSRLQLTVRWTILLAWVVGLDAAATHWTLAATKRVVRKGLGNGEGHRRHHFGYDGSQVTVYSEHMTGKSIIEAKRPPTAAGRRYVWWPSVAGVVVTLATLALAATHNGRRLIAEFPLRGMTTRRLMIAVAVIGIEAVLVINVAKSNRVSWDFLNYRRPSPWPPLSWPRAPPTLALLQAFGRTRSTGAEKG